MIVKRNLAELQEDDDDDDEEGTLPYKHVFTEMVQDAVLGMNDYDN